MPGADGSWSEGDTDKPEWDRDTVLEAEFDYRHEDGRYAYTVLKGRRVDGEKAFLVGQRYQGALDMLHSEQRENPHLFYRLAGIEHFTKGKGDEPILLFRLPELIAFMRSPVADRETNWVYLCEGEKDVKTLVALGLPATTNFGGAGKWDDSLNQYFKDLDVVILSDNDPVGAQGTRLRAAKLRKVAARVVELNLDGLGPKEDVSDWLAKNGRTKDDLLREVESAAVRVARQADAPTPERAPGLSPDEFSTNDEGVPYKTQRNARAALLRMGVKLSYDEFASRYLVEGLDGFGPSLDDAALTRMRLTMEEDYRLTFAKERWFDFATDHARKNSFHPVKDHLAALEWDGEPRIDHWLHRYGGAEDSEYVRAVSSIPLIAAVRRIYQPGCKFDEMPVLESGQGTNKSRALAVLAVREDWFTDDCPLNADSKLLIEQLDGRWIVEMGELKGMRRGEVEGVKSMLSRSVDKARLAYGRMTEERPRQCVFIGTTNDSAYLRDMTGNRRFWPVRVPRFDVEALRRDRDQLWAEAAAREAKGESIRLPEHLWAVAGEHQAAREIGDPIYDRLAERLEGQEGKVRAGDVWEAVGLGDIGKRTQDHNVRLSAAMQKLGWRRPKSKLRFGGPPLQAWVKGPDGVTVDAFEEVPRSVVLGHDERGQDGRPM